MSDGLVLVGKVEEEYGGGRRSDVHDNGGRACTLATTGNRVALDGVAVVTHISRQGSIISLWCTLATLCQVHERGGGEGLGSGLGLRGSQPAIFWLMRRFTQKCPVSLHLLDL